MELRARCAVIHNCIRGQGVQTLATAARGEFNGHDREDTTHLEKIRTVIELLRRVVSPFAEFRGAFRNAYRETYDRNWHISLPSFTMTKTHWYGLSYYSR